MIKDNDSFCGLILNSFRKNILPGLVLWVFAVAILLCYFYWSPVRELLESLSEVKLKYGYLFSAISTAVFGGLIPFLVQTIRGQYRTAPRILSCLLFFVLFWAWKGAEIDAFYRFQGWLWGESSDWLTITKKVCFDMFVFSTFYAVPCIGVFSVWKDQFFDFGNTRNILTISFLRTRIGAMIVSNWIIWIPSVSVVYCMPSALQVLMFNIVLCFWVLIASVLLQTEDAG